MSTPYWKDIKSVAINKEYPRTSFVSYNDKDSALEYNFENSPYYINLNGTWKFFYVDYPKDLPSNIATENNESINWGEITVPGNWEVQGHGVAMYTNIVYDFMPSNPTPPNLPELNPVGVYRREFDVPESWLSRNIYFQVGGAKTGLYVYINGKEVGYSEDSKNPADFLINKYVHAGNNVVTLVIYKYSSGSYLEDQDMWRLGGIERDVVLYSQPKMHIQDFNIVSTLDSNYVDGDFRLDVNLVNNNESEENVTISYELLDSVTKQVVSHDKLESIVVKSNESTKVNFTKEIANVKKWSAEHPNLYFVILQLSQNGKVYEIVPFRCGFRREEITTVDFNGKKYPVLLFNGQPVIYKGVNIQEHNPKTGHYVTEEIRRKDMELLKKYNFNALRFSHYPQDRKVYDLCDEYGIYVVSECNIESHGMGYDLSMNHTLGNNPEWTIPHMDRTKNMYERSKNHACVTFFSLGNEAGNGVNFYKTYEWLKEREVDGQNRPINYERAEWEWNTDMFVIMYPDAEWLEEKGENGSDLPIVPCEYSHAMGNSNGNFDRMWRAIYKYPNLQGGFIWDWVDQGIEAVGKNGRSFWTYGGDYGVNAPSDGNFNINGCVNPDREPHPAMNEIKYNHQNIAFEAVDIANGIFRITNRFFFTDLQDYSIKYSIKANSDVLRTEEVKIELGPQESKEIHVNFNDLTPKVATEYFMNFSVTTLKEFPFVPKGFEVAHDQFRLPIEPAPRNVTNEGSNGPELKVSSTAETFVIYSSKVEFIFNKKSGIVTSYKVDGTEFITDQFGFQPNFWRAPNDNDYGNGGPKREQIWKTMSHNFNVTSVNYFSAENFVSLTINYGLCDNHSFEVLYHIYRNGAVKVYANFKSPESAKAEPYIPRIGLRFRVPKSLSEVEYFGLGPEENYWDRHSSAVVDHYVTSAEKLYFPYVRPQENGHHTQTRWLSVHQSNNGKGLLINADNLIEFNALPNSVEDFDDEDQVDLPRQYSNFDDCFHTGLPPKHNEEESKNVLRRQHHIDDIAPREFVEVNIDYKQQGVAGFNSWGDRVLPEFTLHANRNYSYGFTILPINNPNEIKDKVTLAYE
ncbi:beta-galactosidase [Tritrichomonas foetus]|uniref:beta-galactosidase n=1 Tax=Tritrichomonas foetus TaxID=1144522 RepID=A0A1J4JDI5_9EUKA|nr:beta-galactosidase [Tritrichomonas foetus]OHS95316.1 beta-galactosidase [Tritrichomonas foetus]|eukprot:OHS95316.1 beta-galactosidase [Tritrichomonas foetus]